MTQSIELVLDPRAEAAIHDQWVRLAAAGLPSALRTPAPPHHRPHITVWAGDHVPEGVETAWAELVADLDLTVMIGSWLVFGPRRGRCVLVRQVVGSVELLQLQEQVADLVDADPAGHFGPGHWSPHVTIAQRIDADRIGSAIAVLEGTTSEIEARVRRCRRWDSERRTAWWVAASTGDAGPA